MSLTHRDEGVVVEDGKEVYRDVFVIDISKVEIDLCPNPPLARLQNTREAIENYLRGGPSLEAKINSMGKSFRALAAKQGDIYTRDGKSKLSGKVLLWTCTFILNGEIIDSPSESIHGALDFAIEELKKETSK